MTLRDGYAFGLIFATQGVVNTFADARAAAAALGRARTLVTASAPDPSLVNSIPSEHILNADTKASADVSEASSPGEEASSPSSRAVAAAGDIELRDVHFAFPSRPDEHVLRGVDLVLPRGKVTALVGPSGAGKSTVTQILCRFYDPDAGAVVVGGDDVAGLCRVDWLDAVALVGQEPTLFEGSVAENIRYGLAGAMMNENGSGSRPRPTDEEVEAAARVANAHDFISELAEGYDTEVGEGGGRLSGGQKQRIAIARAVLKDAPVLILDEATSALDAR